MTVKELIDQLEHIEGDTEVVLVTESEVRAYPLKEISLSFYHKERPYMGQLVNRDDAEEGDKQVIAMWPVN